MFYFFHFVGASVNAGSARRWLRHVFRSDGKVCSKVIIVETLLSISYDGLDHGKDVYQMFIIRFSRRG